MDNLESKTLGKYQIGEELGRGTTGVVYTANDTETNRKVALKVAHDKVGDDEKTRKKRYNAFMNEARTAGMLEHENIVQIYSVGSKNDLAYMAMEYVPGGLNLAEYCTPDNLLALPDAVAIAIECATALDYSHKRGVIHRDLKPKNILLSGDKRVKIGDFGIALVTGFDAADTQDQAIPGTPLYMSPEQINGQTVGAESDLFVLGVVMYELLTGRHPFVAELIPAISHNITHKAHVPLRELRPEIPAGLAQIVDRALKKHPAGRYQSGQDMAGDLNLVFDEVKLASKDDDNQARFDRIRNLSFFDSFSEAEVWEILNASHWQEFEPNRFLIKEGDLGDSFHILVAGEVVVTKGDRPVDILKPGTCFGEVGFVTRKERMASVVARTPVTVMEIRAALIDRITVGCQLRFHKAFIDTMAERLLRAMERAVK